MLCHLGTLTGHFLGPNPVFSLEKKCGTISKRFSQSRIHEPELRNRERQAASQNEDKLCGSFAEVYGPNRGKI